MKLFDKDKDGSITEKEFIDTLKEEAEKWKVVLSKKDIDEAKSMFHHIDESSGNNDGKVDITEL